MTRRKAIAAVVAEPTTTIGSSLNPTLRTKKINALDDHLNQENEQVPESCISKQKIGQEKDDEVFTSPTKKTKRNPLREVSDSRRMSSRLSSPAYSQSSSSRPSPINSRKQLALSSYHQSSEENEDEPFKTPEISKLRASVKTPKKQPKSLSTSSFNLFEMIIQSRTNSKTIISSWYNVASRNPAEALYEIIKLLVKSGGYSGHYLDDNFNGKISLEILGGEASANILRQIQHLDPSEFSSKSDYLLAVGKSKLKSGPKQKFQSFFSDLVLELHGRLVEIPVDPNDESDGFEQNILINNIVYWVITMSSCQYRPFRHVACQAGCRILTAICSVAQKSCDNIVRQQLFQKYETLLFNGIFVHRYRDIDPVIRTICIDSLGLWVATHYEVFLDNSYLRYFGWLLYDKHQDLRLATIRVIFYLFTGTPESDRFIQGMTQFISRYSKRIIEIALRDKCEECQKVSFKLLAVLVKNHMVNRDLVISTFVYMFNLNVSQKTDLFELSSELFCIWITAELMETEMSSTKKLLKLFINLADDFISEFSIESFDTENFFKHLGAGIFSTQCKNLKFLWQDWGSAFDYLEETMSGGNYSDLELQLNSEEEAFRLLCLVDSIVSHEANNPAIITRLNNVLPVAFAKYATNPAGITILVHWISTYIIPLLQYDNSIFKEIESSREFLDTFTGFLDNVLGPFVLDRISNASSLHQLFNVLRDLLKSPGRLGENYTKDLVKGVQVDILSRTEHFQLWLNFFNPFKIDESLTLDLDTISDAGCLLRLVTYCVASKKGIPHLNQYIEQVIASGDTRATIELMLLSKKSALFKKTIVEYETTLTTAIDLVEVELKPILLQVWKSEIQPQYIDFKGCLERKPFLDRIQLEKLDSFLNIIVSSNYDFTEQQEESLMFLFTLSGASRLGSTVLICRMKEFMDKTPRIRKLAFLAKFLAYSYKMYIQNYTIKVGAEELDFEDSYWYSYSRLFSRTESYIEIQGQKEK